jgi:hypothetical protein
MGILMLRLIELREEYFNGLLIHQLCAFHDKLDKDKNYTSDYLIRRLSDYCYELGLDKEKMKWCSEEPAMWIDPAGGMHYANESDPAEQYK